MLRNRERRGGAAKSTWSNFRNVVVRSSSILLLCSVPAQSIVIDRIAVIVNKQVIKSSDIDRDLRVTDFLNHTPLDLSADAKRKAADRLIDQLMIRNEMAEEQYAAASTAEVDAMIRQIVRERFGGSDSRMRQELGRFGLTEDQLRMELEWQADVLKFIDARFRPGVLVTDEEVQDYYRQHAADLKREFPQAQTYQQLEPKIRASLEGDRLNQNFEQWLSSQRKREHIVYREGAFQ